MNVVEHNRAELAKVHPELARKIERLILLASERYGETLVVREGLRSRATQAQYYAQGRTIPGAIITYAKPGTSKHESGNAVDLWFFKNGKMSVSDNNNWAIIGKLAAEIGGLDWGGNWKNFKDRPHVELSKKKV
jgi:peptidoglycan L-alanyl-D-glutamate endopeptidase CwlK